MINGLSLLLVLLLVLFQSTVLNLNFLLVFVLWRQRYYWAFFAGLVYDLLCGNLLGLSSLLFLFILLLFRLYSRKFEPSPLFLGPFVFLTSFLFARIEGQTWHFWQGLVLFLTILLLRRRFKKEIQLKLDL